MLSRISQISRVFTEKKTKLTSCLLEFKSKKATA